MFAHAATASNTTASSNPSFVQCFWDIFYCLSCSMAFDPIFKYKLSWTPFAFIIIFCSCARLWPEWVKCWNIRSGIFTFMNALWFFSFVRLEVAPNDSSLPWTNRMWNVCICECCRRSPYKALIHYKVAAMQCRTFTISTFSFSINTRIVSFSTKTKVNRHGIKKKKKQIHKRNYLYRTAMFGSVDGWPPLIFSVKIIYLVFVAWEMDRISFIRFIQYTNGEATHTSIYALFEYIRSFFELSSE